MQAEHREIQVSLDLRVLRVLRGMLVPEVNLGHREILVRENISCLHFDFVIHLSMFNMKFFNWSLNYVQFMIGLIHCFFKMTFNALYRIISKAPDIYTYSVTLHITLSTCFYGRSFIQEVLDPLDHQGTMDFLEIPEPLEL